MASELKRLSQFEEEDWDLLLESIWKGNVVPVCGPELLVYNEEGREIPFYLKVVLELAKPFGISLEDGETLVDFATRVKGINPRFSPQKLQTRIRTVLGDLSSTPQPLLEKLVSIDAFKLFLTTTPDNLLVRTIQNFGAKAEVFQFYGHYRADADIPKDMVSEARYVYHLFGKFDSGQDFAITEDDRLKYSCLWMELEKKPKQLLQFLEGKCLLVLGCGYENWQSRFFLYGLKWGSLFSNQNMNSLFADSRAPSDGKMDSFLSRSQGNIYFGGNASDFIDELCRRFQNYQRESNPVETEQIAEQDEFKAKSIFISYAHEDKEAAFAIKRRLDDIAGWSVWLDKVKLPWGADFGKEIERNIHGCSYFMPLFSRHSTRVAGTDRRYFLQEWKLAMKEEQQISPNARFILPVRIDDCDPNRPDGCVPPQWLANLHIVDAPGGVLADKDVEELGTLMSNIIERK